MSIKSILGDSEMDDELHVDQTISNSNFELTLDYQCDT